MITMYYKGWKIVIEDEVAKATSKLGFSRITGLVRNVLPRL